ncbi:hypothetical protein [Desulfobacula sp.]|uniref:hypothetical protein n=1 Tax=Desulfobacula sp. TaxID=2593537 RepID=UPI00260C816D|nr:hypothetical protein [Desulfobacula sp.]
MHRSKDIDPLTDARLKTQLVVRPKDTVLDTCGGLGYSAIFALKTGAGNLYGKKFYAALFRVMADHSNLFHYTGSPKKIKSKDAFVKNTLNRLALCGFKALCFHDTRQGITAEKQG